MTAARATLACVRWRNSQHLTAAPELPLLRLAAHFIPPWSGIGRFKPDFARTLRPGWLTVPASNFGHVADLQILNDAHCVVFADSRCDFVKIVPADICDTGMQSLYFVLLLLPVVAEFNLSA